MQQHSAVENEQGGRDFSVGNAEGRYPFSLLVLELKEGVFAGHTWKHHESGVFSIDPAAAEEFDRTFESKKKAYRYTQEEFSIACRAFLE